MKTKTVLRGIKKLEKIKDRKEEVQKAIKYLKRKDNSKN
jgi:hypothetical protein